MAADLHVPAGRYLAVNFVKGAVMTRYYVNGSEVEVPFDLSLLDQMLKHIEDKCLEPTAVIREIHVDGRPFAPESLRGGYAGSGLTGDFEKIEIFTGTLAEIAVESIAGAQDYLVKIENAAPALAVKFQDFPETEDFSNLGSLCEGFYFLGVLLDKLAAGYQLNLDEINVQGASAHKHLMKFANIVTQLNDAQEKQEYLLIADTIEYEIMPFVSVWKDIFAAVSQKIGRVN
jgi:hypothetical protein